MTALDGRGGEMLGDDFPQFSEKDHPGFQWSERKGVDTRKLGVFGYASKTLNALTGCSNSKNCPYCWARKMAYRLKGRYGYDKHDPFRPTFHPERLSEPESWKKPQIVATDFMGDWCDPGHSLKNIASVLDMVLNNPQHIFLSLTKNPKRLVNLMAWLEKNNRTVVVRYYWEKLLNLPNRYNGLTITNQQDADKKLPIFLQIPGKKWLSIEPMVGPIDLSKYLPNNYSDGTPVFPHKKYIDQVILGGMSGPLMKANPMKLEWAEQIVSDCKSAGIPVFVKQLHINGGLSKDMNEWPKSLRVRQLAWEL